MRWSYFSQFTLKADKHELEGMKEQNQWDLFAMVHKSNENESDQGGDCIWREVDKFGRYLASEYLQLSSFQRVDWWGSGSYEKWLNCFWFEQLSLRRYHWWRWEKWRVEDQCMSSIFELLINLDDLWVTLSSRHRIYKSRVLWNC